MGKLTLYYISKIFFDSSASLFVIALVSLESDLMPFKFAQSDIGSPEKDSVRDSSQEHRLRGHAEVSEILHQAENIKLPFRPTGYQK